MTHLDLVDPLLFEPGDRMTRDEFLARWEQMPNLKFAELIDGVVHMPSPISTQHGLRDGQMHSLIGYYVLRSGVCQLMPNATWLMLDSAPQPDVALRLRSEFGGKTDISDKLASGAPELVVEISYSSRSHDLGPKLALYQRAGVQEYVAVLIEEQTIEWRSLNEGSYVLLPRVDGIYKSLVFPGFWVDEAAFWADDTEQMLQTLDAGLDSEKPFNVSSRK